MSLSIVEQHRNRVASLSRYRSPGDPELTAARSALAAAKLEQYIASVVSAAPPLSADQRSRLAALLSGGAA